MPKKRNFKDFDQSPKPFKQIRPGNRISPRIPKEELIEFPGEICDEALEIPKPINLLPARGREENATIIYDPDQTYNYLSVSERENRSLSLLPAYVKEDADLNQIRYGFCSSNSPNGFWEVIVSNGGVATFIEFSPSVLTILCPSPFQVSTLTTLSSDSPVYRWTQISGSRTALITPDNVADPIIDILSTCVNGTGCDENTLEPIRIRVETDNPLVFTDLIILNRAIDNFDGLGYSFVPFSQVECRRVITAYRVPDPINGVFLWEGTPIMITWLDPTCDVEFITQFKIESLIPPYAVVATFPYSIYRTYTISPNQQYRVLAEFDIYGSLTTSISEPLLFRYNAADPIKQLFADDSGRFLGFSTIESVTSTDVPGVEVRLLIDNLPSMLGFTNGASEYFTDVPGVEVRQLAEDITRMLGYASIDSTYVITDLGGIIIG